MSLTICGSCAKPVKPTDPTNQTIIVIREDGCKGPKELLDFVLIGVDTYNELSQFLDWCVQEKLLTPPKKAVEAYPVPAELTCPGIPQKVLQQQALLVSREDLAFMVNEAQTCIANGETGQDAGGEKA